MSNQGGLRERKKEATRQAISDVATELFLERGFDNVSVAEVAEAAEVSRMTVFNYFPRKEDLFFDREEESRQMLRAAFAERPAGEAPIATLRKLMHSLADRVHPFAKFTDATAKFWRTVAESPALSARAREMRDELIDDLATVLAAAIKRPLADADARLAASMVVTALTVAYAEGLREHKARRSAATSRETFLRIMERSFSGIAIMLKDTPYA
ncbi:TetR/AcrR family transcriptional regulator [Bradyrhizobium brasilense]|uniref:Transcriptional regulator, TetR family n=1 Tax=Bradyrhizobium brasilense TaxID=1419277 RepID=A0A1G6VIM3_9BRAD|nr:TetR/AcrR family transcriptional regulator [Bradyrhizobium brasilense]MCC8972824.1 TetR/AcrR family transcriptional regulator [Bradyrhizobium brasilense]SDD53490.1 transcriptional regulator, TetR family [Bradyrhizobium brasilense]